MDQNFIFVKKEIFANTLETLQRAKHYHQHLDSVRRLEHGLNRFKSQLSEELELAIETLEGSLPREEQIPIEG